MPDKKTIQRARKKRKQGSSPGTQAGEFVRTEMEHIREGKHGARNTKQAIAIGLSKARRAGVHLPPPPSGTASAQKKRRARERVMRQEGSYAASPSALRRQAKQSARRRGPAARHRAAMKAARTRARRRAA